MNIYEIIRNSFGGMATGPKNLSRALQYCSDDRPLIDELFFDHVKASSPSEETFQLISRKLSQWDYESSEIWTVGTAQNSNERRQRIHELLKSDSRTRALFDEKFPANLNFEPAIVIADQHTPWYDNSRQVKQSFYRDAYSRFLLERKGWNSTQISDLEESTRLVTERLSDPESGDIYPVRGLVVGYVQSGKTANFTGVIARAADAGYRLIIVLAGTLNILRAQTQRRIDRELIGKPFINEESEPVYASDLPNFVDHGRLPSELGNFDWHRLTNIEGDYKRLKQGIKSLEFLRRDKAKPFNHPDNLHFDDVRLLVVKKVPSVLKKVAADLNAIRSRLSDIPTLVIDDESDQASVNTKKPTATEIKDRTATNSAIVSLLQQLPRAQYVGYTATPFANVFVDPNLAEDLFPRDFIISLPRPSSYMGVADFHDLDRSDKSTPGPNEIAFVRNIVGDDLAPANLLKAVDSYILTGAIKLFRQSIVPSLRKNYRHHTMLVHSSHLTEDHALMTELIVNVLNNGGYLTGKAWTRLQACWDDDFAKISATRSEGFPVPNSFDDIRPYLGECWKRLKNGSKPVLTVNGDANDNPDFESDSIWKIIVGGAKLSRGYTIEGLTISYYRRRAGAADALMQMGRWFGFRESYRDLVRLFIGREENAGSKGTIDLYEAFEAVCRDEIEFRGELKKYANPLDGKPILPIQIPPLVPSHLLQPTAKNKMYNAIIHFQNFSEAWKEPTLAPYVDSDIYYNETLLEKLLPPNLTIGKLSVVVNNAEGLEVDLELESKFGILKPAAVLSFLECYRWIDSDRAVLKREVDFLKSSEDTCIGNWLFLNIQGPKKSPIYKVGKEEFRPFNRSRVGSSSRFGVYSESNHRLLAEYLSGVKPGKARNQLTEELRSSYQGIFVFYPTRNRRDANERITPGFALQFPHNNIKTPITFGVRVKEQPDAIVVEE